MTQSSPVEIVTSTAYDADRLVVIDTTDAVWLTFCQPWWHLATWLRWWLTPGTKRWLIVRREARMPARVRVVRLAKQFIRL